MHDAQPMSTHHAAMAQRTKKKPNRVSIESAANGGYVVEHMYDNSGSGESYMPPTKHAFSDHTSMTNHLSKVFGKPKAKAPFSRPGQGGTRAGLKAVPSKAAGRAAAHKRGAGVD